MSLADERHSDPVLVSHLCLGLYIRATFHAWSALGKGAIRNNPFLAFSPYSTYLKNLFKNLF